MKIAILGAGNTGCSMAADYTLRGHDVTLIKTSHAMHDENFAHLQREGTMTLCEFGEEKTARIACVTRDYAAVTEAEVVILATQTAYHEHVIAAAAPHLHDGQILLICPGYLSTAYALRYCAGKDIVVAEAESAFLDGRISAPGRFAVGFRNVRDPIGVYPRSALAYANDKLDNLGTPFVYLESVAEAALHNSNMIVHTVGAVMSIPRIEATGGEYCMYHEVFTPSVWNILEKLDGENMDVLERLGFRRLSYVEACKERNSLDETRNAKAVFFDYAAMPTRAKGPTSVESRYITEDVSQGLVMLEALGKSLDVPTPVASSLIELSCAALGRDLRAQGRTPERLGTDFVRAILDDCGAR
jgi:opine dehydrogenase